jgi:hypothetical protein
MRPAHTIESLLAKTTKNGECMEFTGAKNHLGYGYVGYKGKVMKAHRLAFLLANGPLSDDILVLHRCDNPACINPQHLFLGTHHDNTVDMVKKGRHSRCGGRKSKINN